MARSPNPIDIHVGGRIRLRRMLIGMSQEKLAEPGLTFQQVQKYEKGANRVGAGRLYTIACILGVPVQFFFDDMPPRAEALALEAAGGDVPANSLAEAPALMSFVGSSEGLQLNTAFERISERAVRRRILDLVAVVASSGEQRSLADGDVLEEV